MKHKCNHKYLEANYSKEYNGKLRRSNIYSIKCQKRKKRYYNVNPEF